MTKIPKMLGQSFADIVTWQWNGRTRLWMATLRDGTRLIVRYIQRKGNGRSYWMAVVEHADGSTDIPLTAHASADPAQEEALEIVRKKRG